jgi:hypothetical protein
MEFARALGVQCSSRRALIETFSAAIRLQSSTHYAINGKGTLLKIPLSRILEILGGRDRSGKTNSIQDRAYACVALKPEAVRPEAKPIV